MAQRIHPNDALFAGEIEGELHDRATYRYFWELVQTANVTAVALPEDASARWLIAR